MHTLIASYTSEDSIVQYGDGLFETMLVSQHSINNWEYHWQRLQKGCKRLSINTPNKCQLESQLVNLLNQQTKSTPNTPFYVIKMLVSRGKGLRGFSTLTNQPAYVDFLISTYIPDFSEYQGITAQILDIRLANQPILAGIKHCNSLIYILAKKQLNTANEGLLLNENNELIEAITANIFIVKNNEILTPSLKQCGVEGTFRAYLLNQFPSLGFNVRQTNISLSMLQSADAAFLSNAIKGIIPIKHIEAQQSSLSVSIIHQIMQKVNHPCLKQFFAGL